MPTANAIGLSYFIAPVSLIVFIWELRKTHPHQIYVIWYIFSFFFLLFLPIFELESIRPPDNPIFGKENQELARAVVEYLDDADAELKLVVAVVGLAIVPQWLTYVLSGLSGSASEPRFVKQITNLAIWSLPPDAALHRHPQERGARPAIRQCPARRSGRMGPDFEKRGSADAQAARGYRHAVAATPREGGRPPVSFSRWRVLQALPHPCQDGRQRPSLPQA